MSGERIDRRLALAVAVLGLGAVGRIGWDWMGSTENSELRDSRLPLFQDLDPASITAFGVVTAGFEGVRLVRRDDQWWIQGEPVLHAERSRVDECLDTLISLPKGRIVPGTPSAERVGLDERTALRVLVERSSGPPLSFAIGGADLQRSFVQLEGEAVVRQVPGNVRKPFAPIPTGPAGWRDRTIFAGLDSLDVVRIQVEGPFGTATLEREPGERALQEWSLREPTPGRATRWRCDQMAVSLSALVAERFLDPDGQWGLDEPSARATAVFSDGTQTVLCISDRITEGLVPVRRPDDTTLWAVPRHKVEAFLGDPAELLDRH